jgi:hypothetical protein
MKMKLLHNNEKIVASMLLCFMITTTLPLITRVQSSGGFTIDAGMYWKPGYVDYAPSGVPDFDQRQDNWGKMVGPIWKWTWCGPTAVANSLWWMDSRFEPGNTPPPTISDGYPLLTAYGAWDDHDPKNVQPFITSLASYMDTDGRRTGYPWNGTGIQQMEKGIAMYLRDKGLETNFTIAETKKPSFYYLAQEIERCEDVILLLGIWQSNDGVNWWRVGGHYVTCAGDDMQNLLLAFSDPDANTAEAGGMGRVLPPGVIHNHPARPVLPPQQDTVHNNASLVSQDVYNVLAASPSPGGTCALQFYEPLTNPSFVQNIQGQNCPSEFSSQQGPYNPGAAFTATEVEYSVAISPADWYFKPPQPDYAPSGVPDFDQKQWLTVDKNWTNPYPPFNTWSWCGPVAEANSLWWLDSQFEPNPKTPPTVGDGFPLVQSYIAGKDDHDPLNVPWLVEDLAWRMDTDGRRTQTQHCGTEVHDMALGIDSYLRDKQMDWKFYVHVQKDPLFVWVEDEIERCQDVVLLLGFWQNLGTETQPYWVRNGGHYVTCAGVDSNNMMLAISDPFIDNAEWGFPGQVVPPAPHPHTGPPETLHNNATYVSHDFYVVGPSSSPGGPWGIYGYPAEDVIDNFGSCQNVPIEFQHQDVEYVPGFPINTEIEYAVVVSCKTGIVAAGCEDTNVYAWDFLGNLQWQWATGAPVLSVALDNDARYLASGSRNLPDGPGALCFFDAKAVTNGGLNMPLWAYQLPVSESYDGGWMGTESKSVDVKYNFYNQFDVVAAATGVGLYLFDQLGNQIWHYTDGGNETIVCISQDGNYIVCADYHSNVLHYFSHLRDGVPGWGPNDGTPVWSYGGLAPSIAVYWAAISGLGDYVAVSGWANIQDPLHTASVVLLNSTGGKVWSYVLPKGVFVRVDMPCNGRSVVSVNDDSANVFGCDLTYWSDGGNGWDSGDGIPVWTYWRDKEVGSGQNPNDDFYTVSISENGDYVATGGAPPNTYLLTKAGVLTQKMAATLGNATQSVDLTFTGKYGAYGDTWGVVWFFNKDTGVAWSRNTDNNAPIHSVAISKLYPCMFPYPNHNVAVINAHSMKTNCLPVPTICQNMTNEIYVIIENQGDYTETFDVTAYVDSTKIGTQAVTLNSKENKTVVFTWNTTGFAEYSNYTINAYASIVSEETDVYDNSYVELGKVMIVHMGDVTGDGKVDIQDVARVSGAFGSLRVNNQSDLRYGQYWHPTVCPTCPHQPNTDVTGDKKVDIQDLARTSGNFGWHR